MTLNEIKDLLRVVAESGVEEVEIEQDGVRLVVRRNAPAMLVQQAPQMAFPPMYAPQMPYAGPQQPMPQPAPAPQMPQAAPQAAAPQAAAPAPAEEAAPAGEAVRAPIVGTFYAAPSPDSANFVSVGSKVAVGDVLCIIEAMKLMNEIEAEVAGTITEVLVANAEAVEYDQPLFRIDPA